MRSKFIRQTEINQKRRIHKMKVKFNQSKEVFSVVIAGDVCPGGLNGIATAKDFPNVFSRVKDFICSADLRLVQWETPTAAVPAPIIKSGPNLNSPEETIETVTAGGFNIAMLANNHTGDHGPAAVMETIEKLQKRGLKTVGAGADLDSARAPLVQTVNGKTVAIFNFAENEFGGAGPSKPGSASQNALQDMADVRAAAQKYDFVIVTLHGGHETNPYPAPRMVQYCRSFADAGAKLVFNCHTHCPEGFENWNGTPIVYSPGNCYFPKDGRNDTLWRYGYMIRCSFGEKIAAELEFLPFYFTNECVVPLNAEAHAEFEAYMKKLCAPISDPVRLKQLFETWTTVSGKNYYESMTMALPAGSNWFAQISDPVIMARAMRIRNLFTCESHADLLRCLLRLIEEKRFDEAAARYDEDIRAMQKVFVSKPEI